MLWDTILSCIVQLEQSNFTIVSQWHHMSIMASQSTSNLTVCSTDVQLDINGHVKVPHHWHLVSRIQQSLVDSRPNNSESGSLPWHHDLGLNELTLKWLGLFFKSYSYFLILYTISAIFLYETGPIQWMFNQHCGCWWPGASAPVHQ